MNIRLMFNNEIYRFLIVGFLTVLIDFLSYFLLLYFIISSSFAKTLSFILGASFAYFANNKFTFKYNIYNKKNIFLFVVLYVVSLTINVFINELLLYLLYAFNVKYFLSFFMATFISASVNYLGMKYIVFKKNHKL